MKTKQAFTLIELLVVIAILALLASLLVSSVRSSMDRSKVLTSQNQIRSLCVGMIDYVVEKQQFPLGFDLVSGESWDEVLQERMGFERRILHAPLDRVPRTVGSADKRKDPTWWRSYSMVRNERAGVVLGIAGRKLSGIEKPSTLFTLVADPTNTLLIVERFDPSNVVFSDSGSVIDSANQQITHGANYTVNGRFVYGFCDGRVAVLRPEETIGTGTLGIPRGMWTYDPAD